MQLSLPHRFIVATTCLLQLTAAMATRTTSNTSTSDGKEHHGKSSISATQATVSLLKEEVPPYSAFSSTPNHHRTLQGNNNNGSSDNTFCYQALEFADLNKDRRVDGNEFVTFLKIMGPSGILMDVNTVDDLPEVLFHNFVILACMCLNNNGNNNDEPSDPSCCAGDNAHVPNIGVLPGDDVSTETESYLDMVCFLTETSIDRYIDSIAATTTSSPTIEPTASETTDYPTMYPTTSDPTMIPTLDLTTENPTSKPTESPTSTPRTESPTSIPTTESPSSSMQIMSPSPTTETSNPTTATTTTMPTETPTLPPTTTPTTTPTSSQSTPSPSTATTTTSSPTSSSASTDTTTSTTLEPTYSSTITDVVNVNYVVAIRQKHQELQKPQLYYNEQQEQQYIYYLLAAAMDRLATIVATRVVYQNDRHERRRLNNGHHDVLVLRRLVQRQSLTTGFHVVIPTTIDGTIMSICPDSVPTSERCEDVFASIQLELDSNLDSPGQVIDTFQTELNLAIQNGELQTALDTVRTVYSDDDIVGEEGQDDSQVYIVTGLTEQGVGSSGGVGQGGIGSSSVNDDDTTTTNSAVGGSNSIPLAAIVGLIVVIAIGVIFLSLLVVRKQKKHRHAREQQQQHSTENDTDDDEDNSKVPEKRDLEQARPKSSKASKKQFEMGSSKLLPTVFKKKNKKKETTVNGDGGVGDDDESSHAGSSGWSSHNDVSSESSSDVGDMLRSTKTGKRTPKGDRTHLELDQAIENGDWAAVGVTAALLASQPNETTNERNKKKVEMFFTSDSGEKYQYETTQYNNVDGSVSSRGSSTGGGSRGSRGSSTSFSGTLVSGVDSSAAFGSQSSSIVTTPSEARSRERRLAEIRGEVDELIEYVVPDERAHINEMMSHFQGNEEVLLETLRSMKEKSIAEKARAESHRLARQNIKQQNQQNKDGGGGDDDDEDKQLRQLYADAVDNTGAPADDKWMNDIENRVPKKKVVSTEKNELGGVEAVVRGAITGSIKGLKGAFGDSM